MVVCFDQTVLFVAGSNPNITDITDAIYGSDGGVSAAVCVLLVLYTMPETTLEAQTRIFHYANYHYLEKVGDR